MSEIDLYKQVVIARNELKNIRQELFKCCAKFQSEFKAIQLLLGEPYGKKENCVATKGAVVDKTDSVFKMAPIGTVASCFKNKNGIPRQPSLCKSSKATLEINKIHFTNPEHSLIGLDQFSYIWILFVFNKNGDNSVKAKVHPPRLSGESVGVFSTRSPHRPCAIGLSLIKLDKIIGNTLFLSGVDMVDGTPVLDIKPYIPSYDSPLLSKCVKDSRSMLSGNDKRVSTDFIILKEKAKEDNRLVKINFEDPDQHSETSDECAEEHSLSVTSLSSLLTGPSCYLEVIFTPRADEDIKKFHTCNHNSKCEYCLDFITGFLEAKKAIEEILQNDPRSVYRRKKCSDRLYYFEVDNMHITCWFDDSIVEVLRIKPIYSNVS